MRCSNLAAFGTPVCRYHGARRPEATLRGPTHPAYRHGRETKQAKQLRQEASARLRVIEDVMHRYGLTSARRTPGPKPRNLNSIGGKRGRATV